MDGEQAWRTGHSYAQWVRAAVASARRRQSPVTTLFDSSVPEPIELLRETIAGGFCGTVTDRYTSAFTSGNPFVVAWLAARYGVDPAHILCTTGATGAISLLYRALARRGEHILVETPGFDLFHDIGQAQGLRVDHFSRKDEQFAVDFNEILMKLRPDTRLIVLSDLHNPSGMPIGQDGLQALGDIAEAHGLYVLVDEVYGDFADAHVRPQAAAAVSPRLISVSSLTKIFGLHTLRCGWIVAASDVIATVRRLSEQFEFGVSNLAHAVAALVLEDYERYRAYTDAVLSTARPLIDAQYDRWRNAGLIEGLLPTHGCISFPRLVGIDDTIAFSDWLANHYGVIVAPGEYFGAPGHIRIGHGQGVPQLEQGLAALDDGLHRYRAAATPPYGSKKGRTSAPAARG